MTDKEKKVHFLKVATRLDIDPDRVLQSAVGQLDLVIIVGVDKKGEPYYASSTGRSADIVYWLEKCKKETLRDEDDS